MTYVTFAFTEDHDYMGVYFDGLLVRSGHSVDPRAVVEDLVGRSPVKECAQLEVSNEWAEVNLFPPMNLSDIPTEVRR